MTIQNVAVENVLLKIKSLSKMKTMIKRKNMQKSWLMFMPLYCWSYFIQWWRRKGMRFWVIFMHFLGLNLFFNEEEDVMVLIKLTWCPPWIVFLPQRFVLKEFYAFSSEYQLVINQIRNIKRLIFTLRKAHVSHANSGRNY